MKSAASERIRTDIGKFEPKSRMFRVIGAEGVGRGEVSARKRRQIHRQARRREGVAAFRLEVQVVKSMPLYSRYRGLSPVFLSKTCGEDLKYLSIM